MWLHYGSLALCMTHTSNDKKKKSKQQDQDVIEGF